MQFINYNEFSTKNIMHHHSRQAAGGKHTDDALLRHVARLSTRDTAYVQFLRHTMLWRKNLYISRNITKNIKIILNISDSYQPW
jgi:hypothetical protein